MPSPLGHALGGLAAGGAVAPRAGRPLAALFAVAGILPDLDFLLPLPHRGPSHSIAAAGVLFIAAVVVLRLSGSGTGAVRLAAAMGAAYLSHTLLDWLGEDSSTPRGVMAFWPFSDAFYISGLDLFDPVNRRYWTPGFWTGNAIAVVRELVLLGPVTWLLWNVGRRREASEPAAVRSARNGKIPGRSSDPDGRRPPSA